ncbi:MAG: DUF1311 domain-containing protein [Clostridiales bacterium]|nr:DUF1311 domain-containing protein [Clostridiales bacterium]
MKKRLTPALAIIMIGLLSGCGNADEKKVEVPEIEIITGEQTENEQSESEQSGNGQSDGTQLSDETLNTSESDEAQFSFADITDRTFYFSSGAGGWRTELSINADGGFEGVYSDSDMGVCGDAYPNGTLYYCEFSGMFGDIEKVDEYTYKIRLKSIEYAKTPEEEEIIDGTRYRYSTAYGLDGGEEFYIYLPGIKIDDLPESYRSWVGYYNLESVSGEELSYYGLYNINEEEGFSSYVYEKEMSLAGKIEMKIASAEEKNAELEAKLEKDITQLDMNETAKEIFQLWDDTLNAVWKLFENTLIEEDMEALRVEEREWIAQKDAKVKEAGAEYEGGSIQEMIELLEAARLTKERVYELAEIF